MCATLPLLNPDLHPSRWLVLALECCLFFPFGYTLSPTVTKCRYLTSVLVLLQGTRKLTTAVRLVSLGIHKLEQLTVFSTAVIRCFRFTAQYQQIHVFFQPCHQNLPKVFFTLALKARDLKESGMETAGESWTRGKHVEELVLHVGRSVVFHRNCTAMWACL